MIAQDCLKNKTSSLFWSKIKFGEPNECWEWQAYRSKKMGYGRWKSMYKSDKRKFTMAHIISYESVFGDIPKGLLCLHKCDNPCCCNPNHLFAGTHQDNSNDKIKKNRHTILNGSKNGNSKLLENDVFMIKLRLSKGESQAAIARSFSVTKENIWCIDRGYTWKHVHI